jgi:hypothetical protein
MKIGLKAESRRVFEKDQASASALKKIAKIKLKIAS